MFLFYFVHVLFCTSIDSASLNSDSHEYSIEELMSAIFPSCISLLGGLVVSEADW